MIVTQSVSSTSSRGPGIRGRVNKALPLLTSLAFHGGLVGLSFLTYQSVKAIFRPQVQTTIPETPMLIEQINAETSDEVQTQNTRHVWEKTSPPSDVPEVGSRNDPLSTKGGLVSHLTIAGQTPAADPFIGAGPGGLVTTMGLPGVGGGTNGMSLFGPGSLSGGKPNIFTTGVRPPRSVAFLCDASGSMLTKFQALKGELNKAIVCLRPVQSFDLIFFGDNRSNSLSPYLIMATPENKVHATNFLESVITRGPTDPIPALELAFRQKPQLIFFLTDGDFPDNDAVLKRIRQLNPKQAVKINTIAFVGEGDTDTAFISLLKQIAGENGGVYKHVTEDQLQ